MTAVTEPTTEVVYNEFASKLAEGLEVLGFAHTATEDATEFWTVEKQHGEIEVSINYLTGEAFVEVSNKNGRVTKQKSIFLKSGADCRKVVSEAV